MLAKEILLRAKKKVWTNLVSNNTSTIRGEGLDLCEIRPYQFGDDIRHINFIASSKGEELQTNVFNEDKQLNIFIGVILTPSLYFGSTLLKTETVAEVVATLGFSSLKQRNTTRVILFDSVIDSKEIKNEAQLLEVIETILEIDVKNSIVDTQKMNDFLLQYPKAYGFMVGDFYNNYHLGDSAYKHQLNAIIVRDRLEESPQFLKDLDVVSLENKARKSIDISHKTLQKYQENLNNFDNTLLLYFHKHHIQAGKVYNDDDIFLTLNAIVNG
jgi:uncharacterized protein (DUF58 family)